MSVQVDAQPLPPLADTGAAVDVLLVAAAGLVSLGTALVRLARRRRRTG